MNSKPLLLSLALSPLVISLACSGSAPSQPAEKCNIPKIFEGCTGRVCHEGDDPAGGLDLKSADVDARLFAVPGSADCGEKVLVEPGFPEQSLLYEKLTSDSPSCGRPMPPRGRLSSFELNCLKDYIKDAKGRPSYETCGGIIKIDLLTDENHCGTCGTVCGEGMQCAEGTCINPCSATTTLCGSACVDVKTDNENCGTCGHRCTAGTTCTDGVCGCDADLPVVSFAADIVPIFKASCGGQDCHTDKNAITSLDLSATVAYDSLVGVGSDGCAGRSRVIPMNPDESYLIEKVSGGPVCVGKSMPMLAESLLAEPLQLKLSAWICSGAKND